MIISNRWWNTFHFIVLPAHEIQQAEYNSQPRVTWEAREVYVLCRYIHTIITTPVSTQNIIHTLVIYLPVIFSSCKSLTTIYRLSPIHPQRNHLIWLLCAVVIAFCAILTSPIPLINSSGLGCAPVCFVPNAMPKRLLIESKKLVYFRTKDTVFRVYRSTGHPHPGRLCIRDAMKWRAPW
jgi:hypothetical protein